MALPCLAYFEARQCLLATLMEARNRYSLKAIYSKNKKPGNCYSLKARQHCSVIQFFSKD
jgi:hypothetical protein